MKLFTKKFAITIIVLTIIFVPFGALAFHASGHTSLVVPCPDDGCGYQELVDQIASVVNFLIFWATGPIAVAAFIYSGFLYLTSGTDTNQRKKAKQVFLNVFKGLAIAVLAFVIVKAILSGLGVSQEFILLQ